MFGDHHAPQLSLAMFSRYLARPQADWPAQVVQSGFAFYDAPASKLEEHAEREIAEFLEAGPAPIVFTLGSTAVHAGQRFFAESYRAAEMLGHRAVLILGDAPENRIGIPSSLPKDIAIFSYVPYAAIFPHASLVIHQGGIGTTAQALRAGVPSLIVPFSFDQPDNALRIAERGLGATLALSRYRAHTIATTLRAMLDDTSLRMRCEHVGRALTQESSGDTACDAIEKYVNFTQQRR